MTVKFNVVGIFFSADVDLTKTGGNTVADVMNYIQRTDPRFRYVSLNAMGNQIVSTIGYRHTAPFKSRSGIQYPPGPYYLTQSFTTPTPNPYSVWQYYIADRGNVRVPVPSTQSYTKTTVQDGYAIVWRLVTILNGPGNLAKRLRELDPPAIETLDGTV